MAKQRTEAELDVYRNWQTPDGRSQEEATAEDAQLAIIQALGDALLEKRKEAMDARRQSGIEDDWDEDEEYYQSIDRANPEGETNVGKPSSPNGGPIGVPEQAKLKRSSVFIPLVRPYVDGASARIADMLLPNDDMPWSIKPTPIPEPALQSGAPGPQLSPVAAAAGAAPTPAGPMGAPPQPMQPPAVAPITEPAGPMPPGMMNAAQAVMSQPAAVAAPGGEEEPDATPAEKAAKAATKQITDWLIECQYHGEFRKMLENCAKLGTGVLKGPVPVKRVSQRISIDPATGTAIVVKYEKTVPASFSVDPRNFFPDPACGEDVQRGGYVWEYDTMSARAVQDLLKDERYLQPQLKKVLKEGPCKQGEAPQNSPNEQNARRQSILGSSFGIWYFHGMVDRESLMAAGVPTEDFAGIDLDVESVSAVITMINDTVVMAALEPLDAGGFPYDVMPWQRRAGMIWGIGVARQGRTPQRIVNGAARALMDNAAFTAGPLMGFRKGWVRMADGTPVRVVPRGAYELTSDAPDNAKIGDCISFENVQANQAELEAIIQLGMKMMEDATGLPMLMQGQQGQASDTLGGMTILNNNGSTVLRRIARQADDYVTERHIRRYYYWLMQNSDNEAAKGDFQIDARGSTALVDRELSNQWLVQLAPQLRADPDVHPGRLDIALMKAHRIDWKDIMLTAAEKAKRDKNPPPPPPAVMVAQIKEKGATERTQIVESNKQAIAAAQAKLDEGQLQADYEIALGNLSLKHNITTSQLKAMLAKTTMTLNTQVALSEADRQHSADQAAIGRAHDVAQGDRSHLHQLETNAAKAAAEPAGRAEPGHAFEQ